MKRQGFKKQRNKLHPHNECSICSEQAKFGTAPERVQTQKEIDSGLLEYELYPDFAKMVRATKSPASIGHLIEAGEFDGQDYEDEIYMQMLEALDDEPEFD